MKNFNVFYVLVFVLTSYASSYAQDYVDENYIRKQITEQVENIVACDGKIKNRNKVGMFFDKHKFLILGETIAAVSNLVYQDKYNSQFDVGQYVAVSAGGGLVGALFDTLFNRHKGALYNQTSEELRQLKVLRAMIADETEPAEDLIYEHIESSLGYIQHNRDLVERLFSQDERLNPMNVYNSMILPNIICKDSSGVTWY